MKVVCIDVGPVDGNSVAYSLVLGKTYEAINARGSENMYEIAIGDELIQYLRKRFITVKEFRKKKLEKLEKNGLNIEDVIGYIENDAEVMIPIERMFNEDGSHITKSEYGKVMLEVLCIELREKFGNKQ